MKDDDDENVIYGDESDAIFIIRVRESTKRTDIATKRGRTSNANSSARNPRASYLKLLLGNNE